MFLVDPMRKNHLKGLLLQIIVSGARSFIPKPTLQGRGGALFHSFRGGGSSRTMCFSSKTMCFSSKENSEDGDTSFEVHTWNPLRLLVLRLGLTEPMGTSPLNYGKYEGECTCAYCGETLFDSNSKYDSGSGWPSFWRTANGSVEYKSEFDGRLECRCKRCSR